MDTLQITCLMHAIADNYTDTPPENHELPPTITVNPCGKEYFAVVDIPRYTAYGHLYRTAAGARAWGKKRSATIHQERDNYERYYGHPQH